MSAESNERQKQTSVYCERPCRFEISGCPTCGNMNCDWSEFVGHLWCQNCEKDFVPESGGVFDGPICVQACEMLGIYFDTIHLETGVITPGPSGIPHFGFGPAAPSENKEEAK